MTEASGISFVMPVLNEEKYLEKAVLSVFGQQVDVETELILAIGPSTDRTLEIAGQLHEQFPTRLKLVRVDVANTSLQLNAAISEAKHDVVLRVDAHSALSENYAQIALGVLLDTGAANVGGVMRAVGETDFQKAVAYAYNHRIGLGGGAFHVGASAGPKESVYLGVFNKQKLQEVGGFDPKWVRGQDWELNQRLRNAGHLVWFDPRLFVTYYPRGSLRALGKQFFNTGVWRGMLTRNNPGESAMRYWIPPLLVISLLFVLPFGLYLFAIAIAAWAAKGEEGAVRAWLLIVLPTMHLSWGLGFWLGFVRGAK